MVPTIKCLSVGWTDMSWEQMSVIGEFVLSLFPTGKASRICDSKTVFLPLTSVETEGLI